MFVQIIYSQLERAPRCVLGHTKDYQGLFQSLRRRIKEKRKRSVQKTKNETKSLQFHPIHLATSSLNSMHSSLRVFLFFFCLSIYRLLLYCSIEGQNVHISESVKLHLSFILLPRPRLPTSSRSIEKGGCSAATVEKDQQTTSTRAAAL